MTDPQGILSLSSAFASALDAAVAERPAITALEVCTALGAVAGVAVAQSLPNASAEMDEIHLDAMTRAYRSALLGLLMQAQEAREAGLN